MPKERTQTNLTSPTPASVGYQQHKPEDTDLYKIVEKKPAVIPISSL